MDIDKLTVDETIKEGKVCLCVSAHDALCGAGTFGFFVWGWELWIS
jgi:hypothetical protein